MNKQISISGTGNKYKMKKVLHLDSREPQEKKIVLDNLEYTESENENMIMELNDIEKLKTNNSKLFDQIIQNINRKISGYKAQDVRKKIYNNDHLVKFEDILNLWNANKMECFYCSQKCWIFYKYVREPKQWTLDRINNSIGHTRDNIILSCLHCNLKRRNKDKDKFFQGSNLNLTKLNI